MAALDEFWCGCDADVPGVRVASKRFQEGGNLFADAPPTRDWSSKFDYYCVFHLLADCDPDDTVGCEEGLVCGEDNCAQFHEISAATGFFDTSDCCEGELCRRDVELPGCRIPRACVDKGRMD